MDLTGRTLGKYQIEELLGSGGMAEVYKGLDTRLERPVAIKVMHPHLAKSADFQSRFLREAKATASLQHPNIVNLIDFDNEDDLFYMVMEFVEGGTLEEFLQINSPLDIEKAIDITRQVAAGLEYAHGKSMVHRDIKPANVMFADAAKERIVITDFGVTKLLDEEKMTMTGTMLGTPQYMAPEVVKGEEADQRADIYSLGTMLYEMVTGQVPFAADTPYGVLIKQTNEPVPSPRDFSPDLPLDVEEALYKALEKEPENRYGSAAAFESALKGAAGSMIGPSFGNTIQQPSIIGNSAKSEPAEPPAWRKWLPLGGAIAGVAAIAAITVFLLSRVGGEPEIPPVDPTETAEPVAVVDAVEEPAAEEEEEIVETVAPTATAVPEPTAPPPTEVPTEVPIVDEVFAGFDFALEPAFVCKIDFNSGSSTVRIELDDLQHPPGGTQYFAWLASSASNEFINLGNVSANAYLEADFQVTLDGVALEQFDRIILSAELDGASPDVPTDIILDDSIDPETFAIQSELLNGLVRPGLEQYALALQHSNLSADSLRAGDLSEARRHAEHVINILEGETGPNFGDLDQDGQAQNPGNGDGVFSYLLGARDLLSDAEPINPDSSIFFVQNGIDISIANSNVQADEAVDLALKIFAVDTVDEGLNIIDDLLLAVEAGLEGGDLDGSGSVDPFDSEGGLRTVEALTFEWTEGSFFEDHVLNVNPGEIGRVRFSDLNGDAISVVDLDLYPVPLIDDPTTGYFVFLISDEASGEGGEIVNLGPVPVEEFRIQAQIPADGIFLSKFNSVVISVEPLDSGDTLTSPSNMRYFAEIGTNELNTLVSILVSGDGDAPELDKMAFEADLARQHVEFLIAALEADDLTLARRHAEHVINIVVGEAAEEFGDVDGNGTLENPSEDGFGVREYNRTMAEALLEFVENDIMNGRAAFYGEVVIPESLSNQQVQAEELIDLMFKVLSADSTGEAGSFAGAGNGVVNGLLNGTDLNGDSVIDVRASEGGILRLEPLLHLLTERSFFDLSDE